MLVGSDNQTFKLEPRDGHSIYALNATTGSILWTYATGGDVFSSPAVAHGAVYVGSNDGKVYAIGTYQGPQLSSTPSITPISPETQSATPTSTLTPSSSIPEFPSWIILSTLLASAFAATAYVMVKRKMA